MSCVSIRGGRAIILYIHYIALQRRALFMILTVNIGNTHITVGGYEQDTLRFVDGCTLIPPQRWTNTLSVW